jgi:membrane-bound ClpP family serine protease
MITGYALVALLIVAAIALMVAEMLLPTHGLLGLMGILLAAGAVVVCIRQNAWAGVALLLAIIALTPLVWTGWMKIWPKTPMGRRLILSSVTPAPPAKEVCVGQHGVTLSELRPMGMCELDDGTRVEASSEHGSVPAGTAVRVIAISDGRPTVRVVT